MTTRAILLAGGLGTRLHPLTQELPKPMVPVLGRPWLEHLIERLAEAGIADIVLSLRHGKDVVVEHFSSNPPRGVRLRYAVEPLPLGTGGAIRFAAGAVAGDDGPFLVFNADVVQTFDTRGLLAFHRQRRAHVTIALVEVEDPSAYGAVELDAEGRVLRFVEKPRPGETTSRLVNAGIYVFEPEVLRWIPPGREVSVERETFPALVAAGLKVYGCACQGYWKDIGTRQRYLELHRDVLAGRCPLPVPGTSARPGVWLSEGVTVPPSAQLVPPVVLGAGTAVEEGARLGPWVVTGAGCRIGAGAQVSEAVLWDRAQVGARVVLRRSVLGFGTRVGGGVVEEALIAAEGR
ncbi:Nucleotidyl transferase [Thermaerobacter marianensis DSM 12885]|uniref:Nucleotidyl transferase n=1 Tax=Thermaerobacter marianensis (strain ATCC 700841 / DSM 12885 / JCM 10246 / 7p75a) TaxID=644966 RepID=E6SIN7_THEM7|nr:NDP-sugar synthase [Thermaerobacter marianensis]ADU51981.1 Nucleotidyl transferase [Thermaerobacter marianensis DSM 12885]